MLDDLETLRNRAGTAEEERDQFLALLQRTHADFENYQKRSSATSPRSDATHTPRSPGIS